MTLCATHGFSGQVQWLGTRGCYFCTKLRAAGDFGDLDPTRLTDAERALVGVGLPQPRDPRDITKRLLDEASHQATEDTARLRGVTYLLGAGDERRELSV